MRSDYLFVYGTLLKDTEHEMSRFLASRAIFTGKAYIYAKLYQVSWFPGAVASNKSSEKVYGSLYKITDFESVFEILDDYEGVGTKYEKPNLFKRALVSAFLEDGLPHQTWVYFYNRPVNGLNLIASGDFLKFS